MPNKNSAKKKCKRYLLVLLALLHKFSLVSCVCVPISKAKDNLKCAAFP